MMPAAADELTTITVAAAKLTPERAPQLCMKTGMQAQCLVPTQATATPRWAWLLILLGGWPLFVARRWVFAREPLQLPARSYVYDRLEWTKRGAMGCFLVAGVMLLYAIATLSVGGIALAWLLAVVTTAGWLLIVPRYWVTAELIDAEKKTVRLGSVHTTTAAAIMRS